MKKINKKLNKKLNKELDPVTKELESKAIDFFNIPKEIANDPSLELEHKIVLAIMTAEFEKIFESGDEPSSEDAIKNRIDKVVFEKMAKFAEEIISTSPFLH